MTPPASTEPVHCACEEVCSIIEGPIRPCGGKILKRNPIRWEVCPHDTRARGPVVAQQAPAGQAYQCGCCNSECIISLKKPRSNPPKINCAFDKTVLTHHDGINWKPCQKNTNERAALIAQEREKWERENPPAAPEKGFSCYACLCGQGNPCSRKVLGCPQSQDFPQVCEKIDGKGFCSPDCTIRTPIMDESGRTLYFTCHKKVASSIAQAREDVLPIVRNVINTDASGLAAGLNKVRTIAEGYRWIPDKEWGSYDYTQQTTETLQKEVGWMIDEIRKVADVALKESGNRVIEHIKNTEESLRHGQKQEQSDFDCAGNDMSHSIPVGGFERIRNKGQEREPE